jgi:hypothetical protein
MWQLGLFGFIGSLYRRCFRRLAGSIRHAALMPWKFIASGVFLRAVFLHCGEFQNAIPLTRVALICHPKESD